MPRSAFSLSYLVLFSGITIAALVAGPQIAPTISGVGSPDDNVAYAQGQGRGKGGAGLGGRGYKGGGAGGHDTGEEGSDHTGEEGGGHTGGKGRGHSTESGGSPEGHSTESKTHRGGSAPPQPGTTTGSGGPVWAKGGIPEVELGRLNVARSPDRVIDKALDEAVRNFNPAASASLYSMTAEQFASYVRINLKSAAMIDSPLANLGLYKDLVSDGQSQLAGVTPASRLDLAAIFLGTASDKSLPISTNTVIAVTKIMGLTLTDAEAAAMASKAEAVRQAILAGHG